MKIGRRFAQIDVFTAVPLLGNPVAVVLDGEGLSDTAMQQFAGWTNLSETTFVMPATDPVADYQLRIFTPKSELPFAGHPTLGSAHAVIAAGLAVPKDGRLVQQCGVGLVEVAVTEQGLSFRLPGATITPAPDPERLDKALGTSLMAPPMIVNVGPRWVIGEADDWAVLHALEPDFAALAAYDRDHGTTGQTLFGLSGDVAGTIIVRSFAAADGINEDPVCGSGNGAVAAYRLAQGAIGDGARYRAVQGLSVGRRGNVDVRINGQHVHVGGQCVTVIEGTVNL